MDNDLKDKRLFGPSWASNLGFTEAHYEEAIKKIDSACDANQLLGALVDVSRRKSDNQPDCASTDETNRLIQDKDSPIPSCYSSITSFPSSSLSNQSLDSLNQSSLRRKIYVDGSNVARTHGKDATFSWLGIKLCVDWFCSRQHRVKVFVPVDRCHTADESILSYLNDLDTLVKTPSDCNDDLFVIEAARLNNGVIVSNDLFRDETRYNNELERFIHANRLPYVFVDDLFIPAQDPRGRSGPTLSEFLKDGRDQHNKLSRTKSNQRYQRAAFPKSNQSRCLQSTRSLPMEQNHTTSVDNNSQTGACDYQRQQIRRTPSVVYSASRAKESDSVSHSAGGKKSLCKTKSHQL